MKAICVSGLMQEYKITTIGQFHTNHNEDFLITKPINDSRLLLAVMDGCSMGKESYFASALIGKILRKVAKEISFKEFISKENKSLSEQLEELLSQLFQHLQKLKNTLMLETEELLSTMILGLVDIDTRHAEVICIGDGLICCNGELFEYEQENKPDYLGYHLSTEFIDWYPRQKQRLNLSGVKDLSISTDGIFTFRRFDDRSYKTIHEDDIVTYMLIDTQWQRQETMLKKKLIELEKAFGLKPSDDLSIVRIILE